MLNVDLYKFLIRSKSFYFRFVQHDTNIDQFITLVKGEGAKK